MCGILGIIGEDHQRSLAQALALLPARGKDHLGTYSTQDYSFAHALHAIIGHVPQPLVDNGVFVANCEIYNFTTFSREEENDAQAMFRLFREEGVASLEKLDGDFAFIFAQDKRISFARDRFGVKPLWYAHPQGKLVIASEAKMIRALGFQPEICLPATLYVFEIGTDTLTSTTYWHPPQDEMEEHADMAQEVAKRFSEAVTKRAQIDKAAVLFSGGVDSTYVAKELMRSGVDVRLYTAAYQQGNIAPSRDLLAAREMASILGLALTEIIVDRQMLERHLPDILRIVETEDPVQVAVALPIYFCCRQAQLDGHRIIFSGLGSEEIFAGYQRHAQATDINAECRAGLARMHATDLYRDDLLSIHHGLELRVPFLDTRLVEYALQIPGSLKIKDEVKKAILRDAASSAGVPSQAASRPKLAAQYGSNFQKGLEQIGKGNIRETIQSFKNDPA